MNPAFQPTEHHAPSSSFPAQGGGETPHGWISHTLRHLERWVAWSIAVYTAWLAVFAFPNVPVIWIFVLYAGLIGKWAEVHPPRYQAAMALRGAALIVGAYVLQTQAGPEIGGPGGPFFFWLSITCLSYAFMLRPAWGGAVVALAVLEFALATLQLSSSPPLAQTLAQGGFLCIFPLLLGMRFGLAMRRPDDELESGRIDISTALYNKAGLLAHGDLLLAESRAGRRPLAVAVFDCADVLEVRSIYGNRIARKLMNRIVHQVGLVAGERGLAARTGPAEFTVVLPGMTREKAIAAVERVLGRPTRIEFDAGDSEIVVVPGLAMEVAGPDIDSLEQLYQQLRDGLAKTEEDEQRRQHHMQRERERHSRPMGVAALADRQLPKKMRPARIQLSMTQPAPLLR